MGSTRMARQAGIAVEVIASNITIQREMSNRGASSK